MRCGKGTLPAPREAGAAEYRVRFSRRRRSPVDIESYDRFRSRRHGRRVRIRAVRRRGRRYDREVVDEWDPKSKRSLPRVLRSLGPLRPRRKVARLNRKPREMKARLSSQMRAADDQVRVPRWPTTDSISRDQRATRLDGLGTTEGPSMGARRTGPDRGGALPGSACIRRFDDRVLRFFRFSTRKVTRSLVFEATARAGVPFAKGRAFPPTKVFLSRSRK